MEDCIFCKIVAAEVPAHKVYENEDVLAFLDAAPANPGHTLVIPKEHYQNLENIPQSELNKVMNGIKVMGIKIKDKLNYQGYNVQVNNDPVAGQAVPHVHFHIIPRKEGDGHKLFQQGEYKDGQAEAIANKLKGKNE